MSSKWVKGSKRVLQQIQKLEGKKDQDRLDYVRSLRFLIVALHRSLDGWMQWISNPDIIINFTKEELDEMNKKFIEFTRSFVEYDVEITEKGSTKGVLADRKTEKKDTRRNQAREGIYI